MFDSARLREINLKLFMSICLPLDALTKKQIDLLSIQDFGYLIVKNHIDLVDSLCLLNEHKKFSSVLILSRTIFENYINLFLLLRDKEFLMQFKANLTSTYKHAKDNGEVNPFIGLKVQNKALEEILILLEATKNDIKKFTIYRTKKFNDLDSNSKFFFEGVYPLLSQYSHAGIMSLTGDSYKLAIPALNQTLRLSKIIYSHLIEEVNAL